MNFVCGYHDADLRDATGLGHGRLIAAHATRPGRDCWLPRLLAGDLAGIAITEPNGGSQVHAITATATTHRDGSWRLTGTKTWISRLHEAAVFIVFFKDPAGNLCAGIIDARSPGLRREQILPAGLTGWSWGELRLDDVPVPPKDVLGQPGEGMTLLREHFAHYRPLVAATALGAAAAAHDQVARCLSARRGSGVIADLRDNALISLGRSYAQISAALLATLTAFRLSAATHPLAELWGCAVKAHAVDTAFAAASELTLLTGASGFTASSRLTKAIGDLGALRYADGIHDSLYRSAGRALTPPAAPHLIPLSQPPAHAGGLIHA